MSVELATNKIFQYQTTFHIKKTNEFLIDNRFVLDFNVAFTSTHTLALNPKFKQWKNANNNLISVAIDCHTIIPNSNDPLTVRENLFSRIHRALTIWFSEISRNCPDKSEKDIEKDLEKVYNKICEKINELNFFSKVSK